MVAYTVYAVTFPMYAVALVFFIGFCLFAAALAPRHRRPCPQCDRCIAVAARWCRYCGYQFP